ncbi:MAG: O-antigen ligase family protein [Candidatus Omnitrophota bacterium]|jgi:hypothetical protein
MKKIISYAVGAIVAIQALAPPFEFNIYFLNSPLWFTWTFLFCGFLSFIFIFTQANIWLKILIPYLFVNTFFSAMPHFSMTSFFGVTACAYFYLLCKKIEDWETVIKIIFCVLMVQLLLINLRGVGKDTLFNFGGKTGCAGSVGNIMQLKTLIILCFAFIISAGKPKFLAKFPIAVSVFIISSLICYVAANKSFHYFLYARGPVWLQTFALSNNHPFIGHGLGTFQVLFPILGHGHFQAEGIWMSPHNFWLRILFEAGSLGLACILGYMGALFLRCRGLTLLAAGMVCLTLAIHFPESQSSAVPMLVLFCASIEKEKYQWRLQK